MQYFLYCEGQSHKTLFTNHIFWRERRAEADSNRSPLPLGQTGPPGPVCHSDKCWKCRRMMQGAVSLCRSRYIRDQRITLHWPKSYLLVSIITVQAGVVTTKTDPNAMTLTRLHKESYRHKKMESDWRRRWGGGGGGDKKTGEINTIPTSVGNGVGASSLEIRTGDCSKLITLWAASQPLFLLCWAIEPKTTKLHWIAVSVWGAVVCDTSFWDTTANPEELLCLALCCFHSLIGTRTFRRALTASVDSCAEIKSGPSVS